jgi:hypothetical protein
VPKESASGPANKSAPQAGATVEPLEPEEEEQVEEEAIPDPD